MTDSCEVGMDNFADHKVLSKFWFDNICGEDLCSDWVSSSFLLAARFQLSVLFKQPNYAKIKTWI